MKKNILLLLLAVGSASAIFLTGCSKDDTTPPSISLNGAVSDVISLQGGAYTDPGATATDDEDGSVTVTSDATATNPNPNMVGTYTITYTATDAAGNVGSAVRTVRVKNDAEIFAGTYSVNDVIVAGPTFIYPQTISVDNTVNNKVHFNKFADYANNTDIFGTMNPADSSLWINAASGHDIGTSQGGTCDVVNHHFRTRSYSRLTNGFLINYIDSLTSGGVTCAGTFSEGNAQYSK